ncbi:MAG: hypothetical protein UZ21_OP11001000469 [Microgenomates bacterium OLB22]|nr:MAG: hypothetical protein UZ21_OP11001000469 [Microgenomates bacterium OLB22]
MPKSGDRVLVFTNWEWITLDKPARNENCTFEAGDSVGIEYPGELHVVNVDLGAQRVLVKYQCPIEAYGTTCPTGAEFWLPLSRFEYTSPLNKFILHGSSNLKIAMETCDPVGHKVYRFLRKLMALFRMQWTIKAAREDPSSSSSFQ